MRLVLALVLALSLSGCAAFQPAQGPVASSFCPPVHRGHKKTKGAWTASMDALRGLTPTL